MKRLYVVLPFVVLALLLGWRFAQKNKEAAAQIQQRGARLKAAVPVTLASATIQDVVSHFEYVGSVQSPLSVQIAPKVTGRIDFLQVHEGDRVSKGQVLVRIDPSDVQAQVQQQRATLAQAKYRLAQAQFTQDPTNVSATTQIKQQEAGVVSAKADVKTARANLEDAKLKYQRLKTLYEKGFVAQQDVDDAQAAQSVQQAAVEAAEAKVKQAEAALEYAKSNIASQPAYVQNLAALREDIAAAQGGLKNLESKLRDTVLISPLDGWVTSRLLDPGAVVNPGQAVLAVQYMREVWVSVPIPEEVSARIHFGMPTEITFDSLPGQTFTGKVTQVNPSADPTSRQFMARVTLANPNNSLKPGDYAHVSFETNRVREAVVVPREAVQRGKAGAQVVVVGKDSAAHPRPVSLGAEGTDVIAVTSGLSPGEKVVTMSGLPLREGQKVSLGGASGGRGGGRRGGGRSQ